MSQFDITYLGHVSVLIDTGTLRLVIDPNFSSRIPFVRRLTPPTIDAQQLHAVDAVLFTNAHHHRLDIGSLRYFKARTKLFVPMDVGTLVSSMFCFHKTELEAGAEIQLGDVQVKAVRGLHRAFRKSRLRFPLSLNYIIRSGGKTVFYCSDTKYDGKYFYDLGREYNVDLAILPVDHVGPDLFAPNRFMTAKQALQAFQDLNAKQMLPVCHGAFHFSPRSTKKFAEAFEKLLVETQLKDCVLDLNRPHSVMV